MNSWGDVQTYIRLRGFPLTVIRWNMSLARMFDRYGIRGNC